MALLSEIHLLYFANALVLCLVSLFTNDSLDISLHDTYFVIESSQVLLLLAIPFIVFGLTDILMKKIHRFLNGWLSLIHYLITTFGLIYICFPIANSMSSVNELMAIVFIVVILAQLLFIINVIRSFAIPRRS